MTQNFYKKLIFLGCALALLLFFSHPGSAWAACAGSVKCYAYSGVGCSTNFASLSCTCIGGYCQADDDSKPDGWGDCCAYGGPGCSGTCSGGSCTTCSPESGGNCSGKDPGSSCNGGAGTCTDSGSNDSNGCPICDCDDDGGGGEPPPPTSTPTPGPPSCNLSLIDLPSKRTLIGRNISYQINANNYNPANPSSVRAVYKDQLALPSESATVIYNDSTPGSATFTCFNPGDYYVWCGATSSTGANCTGNPWCEWKPNPPNTMTCNPSIGIDCLNTSVPPNDFDTLKCYPWSTCEIKSIGVSGNSVTIEASATMSAIFTTLCDD